MLTEKVINQVYQLLIGGMLYNINDEDKEEISKNYLAYLYKSYSNLEVTEENERLALKLIMKREKQIWEARDPLYRMMLLKNDEKFDIIMHTSNEAYDLALKSLNNNTQPTISEEEADKKIKLMMENVDKVNEYNKQEAKRLVSEGILDYNYACGKCNDLMSLRLSHSIKK